MTQKVMELQKEEEGTKEETQNIVNLRRQNSNRRSLRGARAKSVVITEKEKNLLIKQEDKSSPQPSRGFVKSMCRFYSDIIGDRKRTLLDRSVSFTATKEKASLESVIENRVGEGESEVSSPVIIRSSSFRLLNRSRSWRESRSSEMNETSKRNSPTGHSVRSQDSGFSDSGENIPADVINSSFETNVRETSPAEMPYVTKIEIEGPDFQNNPGTFLRTMRAPGARNKSLGTLRTLSGLQEGARAKLEVASQSRNGLSSARPRTSVTLPREQRTVSPPETSVVTPFSSSTPVRASFRRTRPQTMICLEDGVHSQPTPVKRESRARLKEIKSRRRWSSMEQGNFSGSPQMTSILSDSHHVKEILSPNLHSSRPGAGITEISPVVTRSPDRSIADSVTSVCVDGTGTRLMLESFLEVDQHQDRSSVSASTIFPSSSLLLAGLGTDTIIEHEAKLGDGTESGSMNSPRTQGDPVIKWWMELFMSTEPECMTYLQSKPILRSKELPSLPTTPQAFYPYETIKTTLVTKRAVLVTFSLLKSHFSALNLLQMNKTIGVLTKQIKDYIYEHNLSCQADPKEAAARACAQLPGFRTVRSKRKEERKGGGEWRQQGLGELVSLQERSVLQVVDRLRLCAHRCQYTPSQPLVEMRKAVRQLEESFIKFVELVISREIRNVLVIIEQENTCEESVLDALNTIISLGNEHSSQVYTIIARVGGVRDLLSRVSHTSSGEGGQEVQLLALRGLSSVCCTVEAVRELESSRGIETISKVLTSSVTTHAVRVEAAGVLAQVTSPWIAENHSIVGLKEEVEVLVEHLTRLARIQAGDDTFLLVSAALANLTFMEPVAVTAMHIQGTATVLMCAVQSSPFTSLFARDQVTTVLANLAARAECRAAILKQEGLSFLVSLLGTTPGNQATHPEQGAAERVLKKAAIALSRLCCIPSVCEDLIALGGLAPLVRLCKEAPSRNYNDAVLVACLAVLRRVARHCGHTVLDCHKARDLIDPKLMDSFLEYSSKQESYV